jgi:hypothetical protein
LESWEKHTSLIVAPTWGGFGEITNLAYVGAFSLLSGEASRASPESPSCRSRPAGSQEKFRPKRSKRDQDSIENPAPYEKHNPAKAPQPEKSERMTDEDKTYKL